jgi:hypothetical protein
VIVPRLLGFHFPICRDWVKGHRAMSDAQLVLVVTATYAGAIGYAEVFRCRVRERLVGTLEDGEIRLTVLAGDKDKIAFLTSHQHPQEIELGFTVVRKDEPYRTAPISGFVDQENTSWEIVYLREAEK